MNLPSNPGSKINPTQFVAVVTTRTKYAQHSRFDGTIRTH